MTRAAAFLDRDGTIIEERDYLRDPADVSLLPGAVPALHRLRDAGFVLVIVTNQSGIARGLLSEQDYRAVQARLTELLADGGIELDAVFHCPHHPDFSGPCECRKPGLGLYREAAGRFGLDLSASIYVGDRPGDVLPALATGGRGFLVRTGYGAAFAGEIPAGITVVDDLGAVPPLLAGR